MATYDEYVAALKEWKDAVVTRDGYESTAAIVRDVYLNRSHELEAATEFIGYLSNPIPPGDEIRKHRFTIDLARLKKVPALDVLACIDKLGI